ncbi:unnamed protein product [Symbiodinium microadriaticum]|nr:unnamed protein product [Symbiodinium microadriaticum]
MTSTSTPQVMALYPGDPGPPRADCSGTVLELGDRLRHLRTGEDVFGEAPTASLLRLSWRRSLRLGRLKRSSRSKALPNIWCVESLCCYTAKTCLKVLASKALPDGDRILFRILMHANHPRYSPLTLALATPLLSALLALMEKGKAVADDSDNFSMQLADRGAATICKTLPAFIGQRSQIPSGLFRDKEKRLRLQTVRRGDADLILEAMSIDLPSSGLIKNCCGALGGLAVQPQWHEWLNGAGAATQALHALQALRVREFYEDDSETAAACAAGCLALSRLQQAGSSLCATSFALDAMAKYPQHLDVQVQGAAFLSRLSSDNVLKASALGACEAVADAKLAHGDDAMQLEGCRALAALFSDAANKAVLAKRQGVAMLMRVLERFDATSPICNNARRLLRDMSQDEEARTSSSELRLVSLLA